MYKLHNNPILHPHQKSLLQLFFSYPFADSFFFTGGTALSAFYLRHRESEDLDFFSLKPFDTFELRGVLTEIAAKTKSNITLNVRSQTYNEIFLENIEEKWIQKIDIVQDQPKHFGEIIRVDNIPVDSLINIATNKILAILGRLEPKDYIDLFIIVTKNYFSFDELFELAKQKDLGLSEFYFVNAIAEVDKFETMPKMKIDFDRNTFVQFYKELSRRLLLKIKPKK